ncbi:hypothetical protein [Bradyrhizobium brasilense]|uniref:hypothetical protein n=1 Tax=Bradyrhizobium brasilense TaxID=1419277 RepID=UPI001E4895F2|nr:hypothetical protein [Bradyrhizobium brasilense]MCC8974311.1 hypothetical protein [Bradyrhizobium brasilense]
MSTESLNTPGGNIQIELAAGDHPPVDLGKLDRLSGVIGFDEDIAERVDDAGSAANFMAP